MSPPAFSTKTLSSMAEPFHHKPFNDDCQYPSPLAILRSGLRFGASSSLLESSSLSFTDHFPLSTINDPPSLLKVVEKPPKSSLPTHKRMPSALYTFKNPFSSHAATDCFPSGELKS